MVAEGITESNTYLTLDAAKALAMLGNNEVGDKVREYFNTAYRY